MIKRLDNIAFAILLVILLWAYFIAGPEGLPKTTALWQSLLVLAAFIYFIYGVAKRLRFVYRPDFISKIIGASPSRTARASRMAMPELPDWEAMTGNHERPDEMAAWALIHHPDALQSSSWLGGTPSVPAGFSWPRNADDKPLHFLAQIDLATVLPEPMTGHRPVQLPRTGALLIFVGRTFGENQKDFATRILTPTEQSRARPMAPPADMAPASEIGFWFDDQTLPHCPVNLVPYLDSKDAIIPVGAVGHRLFGRSVPDITSPVDFQGLDCLIFIESDPILKTQTEHESGFSVWCDRTAMADGDFDTGKAEWHTNV
jgi:hypothetical protein